MNCINFDGRRTQHVGILGNQWTAHDRGLGDNGVPAQQITHFSNGAK